MDLGLKDAAVIVTGGTGGMGRAAADCFADDGARVAVLARSQKQLDETVAALTQRGSPDAVGISVDLFDGPSVDRAIAEVGERWGHLNALVNVAGPMEGGLKSFETYTDVADTPGHEQYTRNMVTGASTADVAVILIDARKGVLTQTRRHSYLASLIGIEHVVLAVNKLDLVDYSQEVFEQIEADYRAFATEIGLTSITAIPVSALRGDNIIERSPETEWYSGPTLLGHLETVETSERGARSPFRMPVQWVNRPNLDFRGFSGLMVGGTVRPGDPVRALPSGLTSTVERVVTFDGDLDDASTGESVTLVLADEIDISRGDLLCAGTDPAEIADQFENVHWQAVDVTPEARSELKGHRPGVIWFTGLSGAGKSTIANRVEQRLHTMGVHTALLDGDNVRHGLNHDLGFTDADRIENIRRVSEVARLMADASLIVVVSFISPFRSERDLARSLAGEGRFCEVFVDNSLAAAEARDPKGLYRKARHGELPNFTGIDSPYEEPEAPEVRIDTGVLDPDQAAEAIIDQLRTMSIVPGGQTP